MVDISDANLININKKAILTIMRDFFHESTRTSTFRGFVETFLINFYGVNSISDFYLALGIKIDRLNKEEDFINYNLENDELNVLLLYLFLINFWENSDQKIKEEIKNTNWKPYKVFWSFCNNDFYKKLLHGTSYEITSRTIDGREDIRRFYLSNKIITNAIEPLQDDLKDEWGLNMAEYIKKYYDKSIENNLSEKIKIIRMLTTIWDKFHKSMVSSKRKHENYFATKQIILNVWNEADKLMNSKNIRHYNNDGPKIAMDNNISIEEVDHIMKVLVAGIILFPMNLLGNEKNN